MNSKTDTLLNVATVLVALCTVTLTGIAVHRQFFDQPAGSIRKLKSPVFLENWRDLAAVGHKMGPEEPGVTVVVFSDFECPMCSTFATVTYPDFRDRYPGRTALVYRHWPLTQHRFAYPAARVAECAADQGRFTPFHDLLFAEQKQLGLKTFREYAAEAGVGDLRAFDAGQDAPRERFYLAFTAVGNSISPGGLIRNDPPSMEASSTPMPVWGFLT